MTADRFRIEISGDPQGIPFPLPAFCNRDLLSVVHQAFGGEFHWFTVWAGSDPILGLPLFSIRRGPFIRAYSPPCLPFGGPFRIGEARKHWNRETRLQREALQALLSTVEKRFHQVLLFPETCDWRVPFNRKNWQTWPRFALVHHFRANSLQFDSDTMRMVRKAEKSNIEIRQVGDWTDMGPAYVRTYTKQGIPLPYSQSNIQHFHDLLVERNLVNAWTAVDASGKTIAYLSVFKAQDQGRAYVSWIASHAESDQSGAMYLLFLRMLESLQGQCEILDFGGADNANVYGFKEHFANELETRQGFQYERNVALSMAFRTFTAMRRLLR